MKVAIAGGSGFIGRHLVRHIVKGGGEVIVLSRNPERARRSETGGGRHGDRVRFVSWQEAEDQPNWCEGVDAFVNLAGETINRRWTRAGKQLILDSRVEAVRRMKRIIERLDAKPRVVISGSGISYYGRSEQDEFDEKSPSVAGPDDFLATVCQHWEKEAEAIQSARVVRLRIGLVLGTDGGALPKMMLPFQFGLGGKIGSGQQWMSWIHIADMVRLIDFCMQNETISGPVNATAPHPVRNETFVRTLGEGLRRPTVIPLPAALLRAVLGEMATLLLDGQRVIPRVMLDHGFSFRFPHLHDALADLMGTDASPSRI